MTRQVDPDATVPDVAPSDDPSDAPSTASTSRSLPGAPVEPSPDATGEVRAVEELSQAVALMRLVLFAAGSTTIAILVQRRDAPGKWIAIAMMATIQACTVWLLLLFRGRTRVDRPKLLLLGMTCMLGVHAVGYYLGIYSVSIVAYTIGIYFFGQSDHSPTGWTVYLTASGGYLVLQVATVFGLVRTDLSLFALSGADPVALAAAALVTQLLLGMTFWLARQSRLATVTAYQRLERASRQIKNRDALLVEVRDDLERARGANAGRYTDQRVGDYEALEVIGRGAMGEVYRARHVPSDRFVALKMLHPMVREEPTHVERFFREAKISSSLDTPHVAKTLAVGHAPDGTPYLVMELLEGHDLGWHLRERTRLPVPEAVKLVSQIGQALVVADDAGIVHRDVKPQNLFLAERGGERVWKVLDFGVSKVAETAATLTQGAAIGTPSYMSPEQARGKKVDHRSDVFALGVIAYRVLTGRPPFTASSSMTTLYNVMYVQPGRPGDLIALEPDIERVLALALAKSRNRRFASAAMFAVALREASLGRLDEKLRRDADALLARFPWGSDELKRRRASR